MWGDSGLSAGLDAMHCAVSASRRAFLSFGATPFANFGKIAGMQMRTLGKTGLQLPILSFGASSLGQEFGRVSLDEAIRSVHIALGCGLNCIDTSPFYGRG